MPKIKTIKETVKPIKVEDYIKSKLKSPISPNTIHAIDSVIMQKYLQDIDYSKYTVFK